MKSLAAGTNNPQSAQITVGERISVWGPSNDWAGRCSLICKQVLTRLGERKFEAITCSQLACMTPLAI